MKRAFYGDDFRALASTAITLDEAFTDVADMAYELQRYPTGLAGFAYSMETLDQWEAERFRNAAMILAHQCVTSEFSENEIAQVHAALAFVCSKDEYAAKEVAGRFLSAVRRVRVLRAIQRHPRSGRFETLKIALEKGRYTKAQWVLAVKLAGEADARLAA